MRGYSRSKKGRWGSPGLPEKKWALKPFLETVLSDLNSTRMLLYWEVMTSGFSEPQNLPCSLESAVSPLRTSTKSYLHTCGAAQLQATSSRKPLLTTPPQGGPSFCRSFCLYCVCAWSCLTLCSPTDCSQPGSSVHGISQARILDWVDISFCGGSS